jgi:hypothetical protein
MIVNGLLPCPQIFIVIFAVRDRMRERESQKKKTFFMPAAEYR